LLSSKISTEINNLIDDAPDVLDTLKELASAINGDASFATTVATNLGTLSTNLSSENSRANSVESSLSTALSTSTSSLSANISSENSRAKSVESSLSTALSTSSSSLSVNISSENSRAKSVESSLSTALSTSSSSLSANISTEISRAISTDADLSSAIVTTASTLDLIDVASTNVYLSQNLIVDGTIITGGTITGTTAGQTVINSTVATTEYVYKRIITIANFISPSTRNNGVTTFTQASTNSGNATAIYDTASKIDASYGWVLQNVGGTNYYGYKVPITGWYRSTVNVRTTPDSNSSAIYFAIYVSESPGYSTFNFVNNTSQGNFLMTDEGNRFQAFYEFYYFATKDSFITYRGIVGGGTFIQFYGQLMWEFVGLNY
jgi:hypothetical protein